MILGDPIRISPEDFEQTVKSWLVASAGALESFEASHRDVLDGSDGEYEIDVAVRYKAFGGANFLMLVECKKHSNPIKREVVQVLNDKLRAIGAQKGMLVSTASFQKGAHEYAAKHGIALVTVVDGKFAYVLASGAPRPPSLPLDVPKYAGWLEYRSADGSRAFHVFNERKITALSESLGLNDRPR